MQDSIFLRGASRDNREAKQILKENNISFVEVHSDFRSHPPTLYTENSAYAYKGLTQIKEYANSFGSGSPFDPNK